MTALTAADIAEQNRQLDEVYAMLKAQRRAFRAAQRQRVAEREERVANGTTTLEDAWVFMMQAGKRCRQIDRQRP